MIIGRFVPPMPVELPAMLHEAIDAISHPLNQIPWSECSQLYRDEITEQAQAIWKRISELKGEK